MNIVFDLDGTLIDSSERMYRLFQTIVPESQLTKETYWALKRDKVSHKQLIERLFPQYDFDSFNSLWLNEIEKNKYLRMDKIFPDTRSVLDKLSKNNQIILLTARQSKEGLIEELDRLELKQYFSVLLVTAAIKPKEELLKQAEQDCIQRNEDDLFVSDMGKDIIIGKSLNYKTVAITHGFMSRERLSEYSPDYMINDLCDLLSIADK